MNSKDFLLKFFKSIFPKSRWGNVAYLILGALVTNWDEILAFIKSIAVAFQG
jgi:hypothetical protein